MAVGTDPDSVSALPRVPSLLVPLPRPRPIITGQDMDITVQGPTRITVLDITARDTIAPIIARTAIGDDKGPSDCRALSI